MCIFQIQLAGKSNHLGYYFFFLFFAWVSAEAATLFTALLVLGSDNNLDAFEATFFEVCSFFDFAIFYLKIKKFDRICNNFY